MTHNGIFRSIVFALCILWLFCISPFSAVSQTRPKVAVVLSGGGAKGMAHIGALRVFERAGIPIDIITGTSMGSIVGGLYSIGYDAATLDSLVKVQDWTTLLSDKEEFSSPFLNERKRQNTYFYSRNSQLINGRIYDERGGLVKGKNLEKLFNALCQNYSDSVDFNTLPIPFACVATNIVDYSEYDFHYGSLPEAMRASMSIPMAFTPIRKGDMVLVDGGLRNNFPVDIARQMGADYVIGVSVQAKDKTADELVTSMQVIMQIIDINCKNKYDDNMAMTDIPIRVNTTGYSSTSFTPDAVDTLIRRGEEAAMMHWDEIIQLKKRIFSETVPDSASVSTVANLAADDNHIEAINPSYSKNPAVQTLLKSATEYDPQSHAVQTNPVLQANVGMRFDNEEMAALKINGIYKPVYMPLEFDAAVRLGKRSELALNAAFLPKRPLGMILSYIFQHNDINVYYKGKRDFNAVFNKQTVSFSLCDLNFRNFNVEFGTRFDYFHFTDILAGTNESQTMGKIHDDHFFRYFARIRYNSENNWNFPTRGAYFNAGADYFTDNFYNLNGNIGFSDVFAAWRMSFRMADKLTFQPMAYGRMIFGNDVFFGFYNTVGGEWFGHYLEEQMPFAGIGHLEYADNKFLALQMKLQYRPTKNNYFIFKFSSAQESYYLRDIFDHSPLIGTQLAYYYNSIFGPLGGIIGYSNRTKKPYLYVNLGFEF